jgi:hypothetical protein
MKNDMGENYRQQLPHNLAKGAHSTERGIHHPIKDRVYSRSRSQSGLFRISLHE